MLTQEWFQKTHTLNEFWKWDSIEFLGWSFSAVGFFSYFVFIALTGSWESKWKYLAPMMTLYCAWASYMYVRRLRTFRYEFRSETFFATEENYSFKRTIEVKYADISPEVIIWRFALGNLSSPETSVSLRLSLTRDFQFKGHARHVPGSFDFGIYSFEIWLAPFSRADAEQIRVELLRRREEMIQRGQRVLTLKSL